MSSIVLEELKYYCNESHPIGALMLKGEWGCGKTYFIENNLKNSLNNTHIFLRISLFGRQDVLEIQNEIKKLWIIAYCGLTENISGINKAIKGFSDNSENFLQLLPQSIKTIANNIHLNGLDFLSIKNRINEKKVVLVFDDLERSKIDIVDLLGCINDYSENQHFNVIVIANEDKILNDSESSKKYYSFKEKLIQKTIEYSPNYQEIIKNVMENMLSSESDYTENYKTFIKNQIDSLCSLFSEENQNNQKDNDVKDKNVLEKQPHNIRSLKYAIHEFNRIYKILEEKEIKRKDQILYTFIAYVLTYKNFGSDKSKEKASKLYPEFYNDNYFTFGIEKWIVSGSYDEKRIDCEIDRIKDCESADTPVEKVRLNSLLGLEQKDLEEGFPLLLQKAYNGEIEFDDYVNLIYDSHYSKEFGISIPTIDWEKLNEGIDKKIDKLVNLSEGLPSIRRGMDVQEKDKYSDEEWNLYERIDKLFVLNDITYLRNKKYYLEQLKQNPTKAFFLFQQKIFDLFDSEMADVTASEFEKLKNENRRLFINSFYSLWNNKIKSDCFQKEESKEGFQCLKNQLYIFENECQKNEFSIAKAHTSRFIEEIDRLLEALEK